MSKTTVMICVHKPSELLRGAEYMPVQVGKALSNTDLGYAGDDTGDNISRRNPNYCELTALYWAWKNLTDADYIGLCHYRRYFDWSAPRSDVRDFLLYGDCAELQRKMPAEVNYDAIFHDADVILPRLHSLRTDNRTNYTEGHCAEDVVLMRAVLADVSPEYVTAFDEFMRGNKFSPYNMFVMPRRELCRYAEWLFAILAEVEHRVEIPSDGYQSRIFGFMAERLMNVYCLHNRLRVKRVAVAVIDDTRRPKSRAKGLFHYVKDNLTFHIRAFAARG